MTSPENQRAAAEAVSLDEVERAVEDIRAGRAVVVVDDTARENEGDIIFAASKATPELLAFTIRHARGLICVPMRGADLARVALVRHASRRPGETGGRPGRRSVASACPSVQATAGRAPRCKPTLKG